VATAAGARILAVAAAAGAQEESAMGLDGLTLGLDSAVQAKYVWRGIDVVDEPVLQSALTVGYAGLSASIWGNLDLTDENGEAGHFTEVDLTLAYEFSWERLDLGVGAINYQFPNPAAAATTELFGSVGVNVPLSPTLTVYNDVDETGGGFYSTVGVGHTFEDVATLSDSVGVSIDLSATVGWGSSEYNDFYFGVGRSAFTDALFSVGAPIRIGEQVTLRPAVNYSTLLDGRIRGSTGHDDNFWAGLSATVEF
jgi:hypothetical protein